jgi:choline kinase
MKTEHLVVLGAGAPHRGDIPPALSMPRAGRSLLQWLIDATGCPIEQTTFVAGYQSDAIRENFPELSVIENPDWEKTGSGASLLLVDFELDSPLLVSYGDILFRDSISDQLAESGADVTVAWDSAWEHRYVGRDVTDLGQSEKVMVRGETVVRLGTDIPVDWADGEFIGLVRFSPRALKALARLRSNRPASLNTGRLPDYIEYLRASDLSVAGVDVNGQWAEFNEPRDIAHFILGTKAETLSRLRAMVQHSVVQDQISCTVGRWRRERAAVINEIQARFTGQTLVVRSSAQSEDSFESSNAGRFESILRVDPENGIASAMDAVVASYGQAKDHDQVLIQPMITNATVSGVAFTRTLSHGAPWYVVNYDTAGNTEAVTSGVSGDHLTLVKRRASREQHSPDSRLDAVFTALEEIETLLGYDSLDVEFAYDDLGQLNIFQVRPMVANDQATDVADDVFDEAIEEAVRLWESLSPAPPHFPGDADPMFGVMPDWNPAEIIGTAPGALAVSL